MMVVYEDLANESHAVRKPPPRLQTNLSGMYRLHPGRADVAGISGRDRELQCTPDSRCQYGAMLNATN